MIPDHSLLKFKLIDQRSSAADILQLHKEVREGEVIGFDIETEDSQRHAGLNVYNNKTRHVFDHRRTVITGFSIYVEGSDTAYYVNTAHADVENRLSVEFARELLAEFNPEALIIAHNASYEMTMLKQCWDEKLSNVVCTLQMAVSHHGPDEYPLDVFYASPLPSAFWKFGPQILSTFDGFEQGQSLSGAQQELLGKFISKTSTSEHSYNGFVKSIAYGYSLKRLTKSRFGFDQTTFEEVLGGKEHMGELTGEEVLEYGADDAYWAVRHYRDMFDDMVKNNPKALVAFFETENPMVELYSDAWREGIRLDLGQVFVRRDAERVAYAEALRKLKRHLREALPFEDDFHPVLLKREKWYTESSAAKKRADIVRWVNTPDSDDDFEQCFQVSNPIGNAWFEETTGGTAPKGKLNLVHYMSMRTIVYDLLRLPVQYDAGSVASDADARGKIREQLEPGVAADIMADLQEMSDIEQRIKLYLTPYSQLMDPETSRVYPSLSSQLATRRLATSFPNPMQLAKSGGSAYIRSFYLGDDDDCVVVSADWSAIELVLIGDMSDDDGFREVYGQLPYGDMHSGSAVDGLSVKWMPGITEEEFREFKFGNNPEGRKLVDFSGREMTPKDFHKWARGTAIGKGINFSYPYSGALSAVAANLGLSDQEHWDMVDKYRSRFPKMEAWRVGVQDEAIRTGFITLPDGHRRTRFEVTQAFKDEMSRKFGQLSSRNAMTHYGQLAAKRIHSRGKNQAVNAMIQGTCATLAKRSLLNLRKLVADAGLEWGVDARLMMPIHDELVFSVRKSAVMTFIPLLRQAMETHPEIVKSFPLNCTVAMGRTFRPFDSKNPKMSQIELDEAQIIPGIVAEDLRGEKLSDEKVAELLEWMFQ